MSTRLAQILSAMMPAPEQTLLLRAALLRGDLCREAWKAWSVMVGEPKQAMTDDRGAVKRLIPALYVALRESGVEVDASLAPYLKLAYVREQMRSRTYYRICGDVLRALRDADVPVIMLRGGALAATVYPDPAIRHCHDIALLVRNSDVGRARAALLRTGRTSVPWNPADGGPAAILRDETSLPIELHTQLLDTPYYAFGRDAVINRCERVAVAGVETLVLCPDDALLHVCAHASYSEARWSMRWVTDVFYIVRQSRVQWSRLLQSVSDARVDLPLSAALAYAHDQLDVAVPSEVLLALGQRASTAPAVARDIALRGVRAGDNAGLRVLFNRMPRGWSVRLAALYWLLFPSHAYVRDVVGVTGRFGLARHYARRPLGYLRSMLG